MSRVAVYGISNCPLPVKASFSFGYSFRCHQGLSDLLLFVLSLHTECHGVLSYHLSDCRRRGEHLVISRTKNKSQRMPFRCDRTVFQCLANPTDEDFPHNIHSKLGYMSLQSLLQSQSSKQVNALKSTFTCEHQISNGRFLVYLIVRVRNSAIFL